MTYRQLKGMGILLLIMGLLFRNTFMILPGMVLSLISLISWYWSSQLLHSVHCSLRLNEKRAMIGDRIEVTLTFINDQPFPIPSLQCSLDWPGEILLLQDDPLSYYRTNRWLYTYMTSLLWFQKVTKKLQIECRQRGEYFFGPLDLCTMDLFGFQAGQKRIDLEERLIIYPRILNISIQDHQHRAPFGDKRRESFIFEDPSLFKGLREYRPTDPFSRIEWKATARTNRLMTRIVDASTAMEIALVINTTTGEYLWELDRDLLERTLLTAASLLHYLSLKRYSFSIFLNGIVRGRRHPAAVTMGTGRGHFHSCMEVLGRILPSPHVKYEKILTSTGDILGDRSQILLITGSISKEVHHEILRQKKRGRELTAILTKKERDESLPSPCPTYRIKEEETWDAIQQITLLPIRR